MTKPWPTDGTPVRYEDVLEPIIRSVLGQEPYTGYAFPDWLGGENERFNEPSEILAAYQNTELALVLAGYMAGVEQGRRLAAARLSGWNEALYAVTQAIGVWEPSGGEADSGIELTEYIFNLLRTLSKPAHPSHMQLIEDELRAQEISANDLITIPELRRIVWNAFVAKREADKR